MRAGRVFLWCGMIFSVVPCVPALVVGGITVGLQAVAVTPAELRPLYVGWIAITAGTFILSVIFLILMFRKGELGGH
jgi:hypothetical protein